MPFFFLHITNLQTISIIFISCSLYDFLYVQIEMNVSYQLINEKKYLQNHRSNFFTGERESNSGSDTTNIKCYHLNHVLLLCT